MTTTTTAEPTVDALRTGFSRVRRSLRRAEWNHAPLEREPAWQPGFVDTTTETGVTRLSLTDFGYGRAHLDRLGDFQDRPAYSAPHRLLTREGAAAFRAVCEALADRAPDDDYIVSHRVRNAVSMSRFIRDMTHDETFLAKASAIAGVPLVPHPLTNAGVCLNYFDDRGIEVGGKARPQVAKWHYDGMTYVFVIQLADSTEFTGGDLLIYQGTRASFAAERAEVIAKAAEHPKVFRAPFEQLGDTVYSRGSDIWHAVTPVTAGKRISAVLSFFCPVLPTDSNEFWHVAAEDGLLPSVGGFARLLRAQQDALGYCRREGVNLVPLAAAAQTGQREPI
ncbi:hypothetical protein N8J89_11990 [Crossiella sp. CA-258035]|uniref:hypothetical protein n=1 Tax=Crossiella sp. CA-258035 TaxID=2981138 RepID=UPI0024BC8694|nr:hypothetical protein [Crossiella sp. CA-258035]WHT21747.1 hypothetical protein N8J89_11990 [Crossiella sp. CA-258035]